MLKAEAERLELMIDDIASAANGASLQPLLCLLLGPSTWAYCNGIYLHKLSAAAVVDSTKLPVQADMAARRPGWRSHAQDQVKMQHR